MIFEKYTDHIANASAEIRFLRWLAGGLAALALRSSRFLAGSNAMSRYYVAEFTKDGKLIAVISGLGKNRGRWDADHSRSAAYRHARILRQAHPGRVFRVI